MPNHSTVVRPRSSGTTRSANHVRSRQARRFVALLAGLGLAMGLAGCSALDVSDPTTIQDSSLDNPSGAKDLWTVARVQLFSAASDATIRAGVFSDEFFVDAPPGSTASVAYLDRRESALIESLGNVSSGFDAWQYTRTKATVALPRVRAYAAVGARDVMIGELFALRAFAATRLAEDFCPGFPLREIVNYTPVYGPPFTTAEAFTAALAEFDSAMVYANDSARVLNFARIGKARALLGLGRFTEAGAAVAAVPTGYEFRGAASSNRFSTPFQARQSALPGVANIEGGVGIDFSSSSDPRMGGLRTIRRAMFGDTTNVMYASAKYTSADYSIVVANDVEARLIQAEAALHAHDGAWLTILNDLRQTHVTPAMPLLTDPGSFAAQVDLLFRERAMWLFATGHRLGDLRRLVRSYGRASETVFPTGTYRTNGSYGTATSIPFNSQLEVVANPAVTGCTE